MSTHSLIAYTDDTVYDGIFCHYDGDPEVMVPALAGILTRDKMDAVGVLTGSQERREGGTVGHWEIITDLMPAVTDKPPYATLTEYINSLSSIQRPDQGVICLYTALGLGESSDFVTAGYGLAGGGEPIRFSGKVHERSDSDLPGWVYLLDDELAVTVCRPGVDELDMIDTFTRQELTRLRVGDKKILHRLQGCG